MRIILCGLLMSIFYCSAIAQNNIEINAGIYVEAQNYGGEKELKRFLLQEMSYPSVALLSKTEGTVEVASIVNNKTGVPSKIHIKESVSEALDAEAIRLYKMLLYNPLFYRGADKIYYSTLKFKFSVKNYQRNCKKRGYNLSSLNETTSSNPYKIYRDNEVDVKPQIIFEDTLENIATFIQKNMKYPQGTLSLNITGTVKLFFVVESSGRITNIKVQRPVGGGGTEEAIRLLLLTQWKAGEKSENKVRVSKSFEVDFMLTNESSMEYVPRKY